MVSQIAPNFNGRGEAPCVNNSRFFKKRSIFCFILCFLCKVIWEHEIMTPGLNACQNRGKINTSHPHPPGYPLTKLWWQNCSTHIFITAKQWVFYKYCLWNSVMHNFQGHLLWLREITELSSDTCISCIDSVQIKNE